MWLLKDNTNVTARCVHSEERGMEREENRMRRLECDVGVTWERVDCGKSTKMLLYH